MRFTVELLVDVDLDAWMTEYGCSAAEALMQAKRDLRDAEWYLSGPKWEGLARVGQVRITKGTPAIIDLDRQPTGA